LVFSSCYGNWLFLIVLTNSYLFGYRVKFYTQEIVFFRQDQLYTMRRSCLMPPSETETVDPFQHVIRLLSVFSPW
jgi:hypothetical protein